MPEPLTIPRAADERSGAADPFRRGQAALAARGTIALFFAASAACFHTDDVMGPTPTVSVDDIYWSAWRDPEGFDTWLSTQTPPPNAASCLEERADLFFRLEQDQLLTCRDYLSGSRSWNECHDQADNYHNGGVVAQDIARALNGTARFADTSGGAYLTLARQIIGPEWTAFIDSLRRLVPPIEC